MCTKMGPNGLVAAANTIRSRGRLHKVDQLGAALSIPLELFIKKRKLKLSLWLPLTPKTPKTPRTPKPETPNPTLNPKQIKSLNIYKPNSRLCSDLR